MNVVFIGLSKTKYMHSASFLSDKRFRKAPKRYSKDYTATIHSVENIILKCDPPIVKGRGDSVFVVEGQHVVCKNIVIEFYGIAHILQFLFIVAPAPNLESLYFRLPMI